MTEDGCNIVQSNGELWTIPVLCSYSNSHFVDCEKKSLDFVCRIVVSGIVRMSCCGSRLCCHSLSPFPSSGGRFAVCHFPLPESDGTENGSTVHHKA